MGKVTGVSTGGNGPPAPDESLVGRIYLILLAATKFSVWSSDDALLRDELDGLRRGNSKLVGQAVAFAHRCGWIMPLYDESGRRMSIKSARRSRACGIIELWQRTDSTDAGLRWAEQHLRQKPPPRTLFDID